MLRQNSNSSFSTILLPSGEEVFVDNDDYEKLKNFKWRTDKRGYAIRTVYPLTIYMHREIMRTPKKMVVDHINGNTLDNRKSNLRNCTHQQNMQNRTSTKNVSGYRNVYWHKAANKWMVSLKHNGRGIYLGCYKDKEEAHRIAEQTRKQLFGEFAGRV